jgi:pimeloyl-ACP methyl ester carboxylesterase
VTPRPAWFDHAVSAPAGTGELIVGGAPVAYRTWGRPGPGMVLVHGGSAHARWWDHIAPQLARDLRVVAVDLSGHGDSGWRKAYTFETWAEEVLAVAQAGGVSGRPLVVGHSMGGLVACTIGSSQRGGDIAGVVSIDCPLDLKIGPRPADFVVSTYGSAEEAIAQFRVVPPDDHVLPYVAEYVATNSVVRREGHWAWKFDPLVVHESRPPRPLIENLRVPTVVFGAQHGFVTGTDAAEMAEVLGPRGVVIEIPSAGHHVPLSQPLPLVVGLRTVLTNWPAVTAWEDDAVAALVRSGSAP